MQDIMLDNSTIDQAGQDVPDQPSGKGWRKSLALGGALALILMIAQLVTSVSSIASSNERQAAAEEKQLAASERSAQALESIADQGDLLRLAVAESTPRSEAVPAVTTKPVTAPAASDPLYFKYDAGRVPTDEEKANLREWLPEDIVQFYGTGIYVRAVTSDEFMVFNTVISAMGPDVQHADELCWPQVAGGYRTFIEMRVIFPSGKTDDTLPVRVAEAMPGRVNGHSTLMRGTVVKIARFEDETPEHIMDILREIDPDIIRDDIC
jgi:hypothetical protein